jgi:hypothetical protein
MNIRKPRIIWATWRGPGWVPCLWSAGRQDAEENCDSDEDVVRVRVEILSIGKRRRGDAREEPT